jgi:DMSO/TMAO reductase YedYZ heme-binding membrane subunit
MRRDRLFRHAILAGVTAVVLAAAVATGPLPAWLDRLSIVSAYLCLVYLSLALIIGPKQAIRSGKPTVNNLLRRDLGIWGAVMGFGHFYLAIVLSMNNEYLNLFVYVDELPFSVEARYLLYSWGVIAGFVVGVLFIPLVALSNDRSLRLIGQRWWKRLQRLAYVAFSLTVLHAFAFQILESRQALLISIVATAVALIFIAQLVGIAAVRKAADAGKEFDQQ